MALSILLEKQKQANCATCPDKVTEYWDTVTVPSLQQSAQQATAQRKGLQKREASSQTAPDSTAVVGSRRSTRHWH
jgi:hypothetical protein